MLQKQDNPTKRVLHQGSMFSRRSVRGFRTFQVSPHQPGIVPRLSRRTVFATSKAMSGLFVDLTTPNGIKYTQPLGLYINNEFVASSGKTRIETINPSDESPIASVHAAESEDVDRSVAAARAAFNGPWRDMPSSERGDMILELSRLVEKNKKVLAAIETWDNGKPYAVALNEDLVEVVATLKYYAGWADKLHGQVVDTGAAKLAYTIREPVGVCAQIIPWNVRIRTVPSVV